MTLDLKITGGTIVDGTGQPRFRGDIGVKDGRIVAIGKVNAEAAEEIDATGLIVSPGFIDCHTHYDAQVMWDKMLSPSVYHGVTTVLTGNCGFTLAPLSGRPEDLDYLLPMLARVEGMPLSSLKATINPTWRTFAEFFDAIDGTVAINTAFLAGHSTIRRHVMGNRAVGSEATPKEIEAMVGLLHEALADGCTGFSSTLALAHSDHNGDGVPSRYATDEEILALSKVVKDYEGTWLEMNAGGASMERQKDLMTAMSLSADRALNWNLFVVRSQQPESIEQQLSLGRHAQERGARIYGLIPAVPLKNVINFRTGMLLDMLSTEWSDLIRTPHSVKIAAMRDGALRRRLERDLADNFPRCALCRDAGDMVIEQVDSAKNAQWVGKTIGAYAEAVGKAPFDALFDLAIEEDLGFCFSGPEIGADEASWQLRGELWQDANLLIGGSDAGAHIDAINTFAVSTQLLGEGVRNRGLLSLEDAVRRITSLPAGVFGLTGRGRIEESAAADIVVFDPDTIDCGPITMRNDVPGGETRLYSESIGVQHVIVNGVPVANNNAPTGRKGGKVLRSGRDTHTVALDEPRS